MIPTEFGKTQRRKMKSDIEFIREALLEIEEKCEPMKFYPISSVMEGNGYDNDYTFNQLLLMEEAGLFGKTAKNISGSFSCMGLSNCGYDFLETIRNDVVWEKTKNEIQEKKLPKTIRFIAEVAGIFVGELLKHKNG